MKANQETEMRARKLHVSLRGYCRYAGAGGHFRTQFDASAQEHINMGIHEVAILPIFLTYQRQRNETFRGSFPDKEEYTELLVGF